MKRNYRFLEADSSKMPPDYSSRSTKRKLMLLVGALGLVIVLMTQAANPQNWQWFSRLDRQSKLQKDMAATPKTGGETFTSNPSPKTSPLDRPVAIQSKNLKAVLETQTKEERQSFQKSIQEIDAEASKFWSNVLNQMSPADQFHFSVWLQSKISAKNGPSRETDQANKNSAQKIEPVTIAFDSVAKLLSEQVKTSRKVSNGQASFVAYLDWVNQQVAANSSTESSDSEKSKRSSKDSKNVGVDSAADWSELDSRIIWLTTTHRWIDPIFLASVKDGSVMGVYKERAAIIQFYSAAIQNRALTGNSSMDGGLSDWKAAEKAVDSSLLAQPEVYRGKVLQIEGQIQMVEIKKVTNKATQKVLGADYCFVCWVASPWAGKTAISVWCPPRNASEEKLKRLAREKESVNIPVKVTGLFYKKSTYMAQSGQQPTSLVVFAPQLDFLSGSNPFSESRKGSGNMYSTVGVVFLVLMLAMVLFRSYQSIQKGPTYQVKRRKNRLLDADEDEPQLMEIAEKIEPRSETDWSHLKVVQESSDEEESKDES